MPEGVLSMVKVLEYEGSKALLLDSALVREPRRLYMGERMNALKVLKLHTLDDHIEQKKSKHLGSFARSRKVKQSFEKRSGLKDSINRYNSGRDKEFSNELVRLSNEIGNHLSQGTEVPLHVWSSFDNLNNNRKFFRKKESDMKASSRDTCGPGSYYKGINETIDQLPKGGTFISKETTTIRDRNDAEIEAEKKMKFRESSFRKTKDFSKDELEFLQRLFNEFGRPKFPFKRGNKNYEEHLEKFAYRHIQIYHKRNLDDVKKRVHDSFQYNKFHDIGEKDYWKIVKKDNLDKIKDKEQPNLLNHKSTENRAPAYSIRSKNNVNISSSSSLEIKEDDQINGSGSNESYDYRSIGKQISSEKPDAGSVTFTRAGAAGTMMTIAEQIANLTPTPTTYKPNHNYVKDRIKAYPWKRGDGNESMVGSISITGPGSYEAPSMTGIQYDSTKKTHKTYSLSKTWSGRLPKELEPIKEKYAAGDINLPPIPKLTPLHQ
mmetsp:Transcript_16830/g.21846  ORF Transcript_16830/g.21846 Transcript_16830/m.21846 type:complete len:490 (+) Transcript_16830:120-1589(+)